MAGSYSHAVDDEGRLLPNEEFIQLVENLGDAYEMAEEMYGMIWWLAEGDAAAVATAQQYYKQGIEQFAPGEQKAGF